MHHISSASQAFMYCKYHSIHSMAQTTKTNHYKTYAGISQSDH